MILLRNILLLAIITLYSSCTWIIRTTFNLNKSVVYESKQEATIAFNNLSIPNSIFLFAKNPFEIIPGDSTFIKEGFSGWVPHLLIYNNQGDFLNINEQPGACSNRYLLKTVLNGSIVIDSLKVIPEFDNLNEVLTHLTDYNDNSITMQEIGNYDYYFVIPWNTLVSDKYKKAVLNIQNLLDNYSCSFIVISKELIKE